MGSTPSTYSSLSRIPRRQSVLSPGMPVNGSVTVICCKEIFSCWYRPMILNLILSPEWCESFKLKIKKRLEVWIKLFSFNLEKFESPSSLYAVSSNVKYYLARSSIVVFLLFYFWALTFCYNLFKEKIQHRVFSNMSRSCTICASINVHGQYSPSLHKYRLYTAFLGVKTSLCTGVDCHGLLLWPFCFSASFSLHHFSI